MTKQVLFHTMIAIVRTRDFIAFRWANFGRVFSYAVWARFFLSTRPALRQGSSPVGIALLTVVGRRLGPFMGLYVPEPHLNTGRHTSLGGTRLRSRSCPGPRRCNAPNRPPGAALCKPPIVGVAFLGSNGATHGLRKAVQDFTETTRSAGTAGRVRMLGARFDRVLAVYSNAVLACAGASLGRTIG